MAYPGDFEAQAEEELRGYLAPHQPELAPRLARRLARRPRRELETLLDAFRSASATPLLRRAVDEALAEELGSTGLVGSPSPSGPREERPLSWASRETEDRLPRRHAKATAASHSILERIASLQPELSPKLLEFIESQGDQVIDECMHSDAALQQHVEAGLVALFAAEERAADPGPSQIFRTGPGHRLPGGNVAKAEGVRTIKASVRMPAAPPKARPEVPPAPPKFATAGYSSTSQETTAAVAKSPSIAAAESRPLPAPARCSSGVGRRIWGLQELLDELGLLEYEEAANAWGTQMGAAFLEELVENSEELAQAICLKPLEQKRLQRMGPEVAARLRLLRPSEAERIPTSRPVPSQAAAAPEVEPEAPGPESLPTTALWAPAFGRPKT